MEIVSVKIENMGDYGKSSEGIVYSVHVIIKDIEVRAADMVSNISNTSWISKLDAVARVLYSARSERTITKLVNYIINRVENTITDEFGEFLVSDSAQSVLVGELDHEKVPLAEFLKEKDSGNPGFDFHTETHTNLVAFGEAKYSGKGNPHGKSLSQIVRFIDLKKDDAELVDLRNFVSESAMDNSLHGRRAYVAAFSVNHDNPEIIIRNSLKSKFIDDLLVFPEVYVIGVEVDA